MAKDERLVRAEWLNRLSNSCEREISKKKGATYKVAASMVFLQRSEQVEAAWLLCRLTQRSGRERLDGEGVWAVRCSRTGGVRILGLE